MRRRQIANRKSDGRRTDAHVRAKAAAMRALAKFVGDRRDGSEANATTEMLALLGTRHTRRRIGVAAAVAVDALGTLVEARAALSANADAIAAAERLDVGAECCGFKEINKT